MTELPPFRAGRARREQGVCEPVSGLSLPFGIIEGAAPGPCLLVTAGVHGSELCGIETALRLLTTDPHDLRGTLVVLPILNPHGFKSRSIYVMPQDGQNLNRMFPGRPDGSFSEQLANWLVTSVYAQVDAYIDLHGGDLNEDLTPFTLFPAGSEPAQALACAFGLPISVRTSNRGFTINAAADSGVPSIIAEVGGNGLRDENEITLMSDGVWRVMQHLGMSLANTRPAPVVDPQIVSLWSTSAPCEGLWYPAKPLAVHVTAGDVLGQIRDVFGTARATIVAEVSGTLLYRMTSLAVNVGEPLLGVAAPFEGTV